MYNLKNLSSAFVSYIQMESSQGCLCLIHANGELAWIFQWYKWLDEILNVSVRNSAFGNSSKKRAKKFQFLC